jgi:CubicO group peptidase (beta-lactamase class C family)
LPLAATPRRGWRAVALTALLAGILIAATSDGSRAESPLPAQIKALPEKSAQAHFSHEKLARVGDYLRDEIAAGKIPGASLLIQQHGHPVYSRDFGFIDAGHTRPMTPAAIFSWYSMSKPITSVAAMMLVEDGKLALGDPVSKYIPEFADVKVGSDKPDETGKPTLAPLQRPITIEDLLRHTSGLTYGFYGESRVKKRYANAGLFDGDFDNAEFVARLAKLPLAEQPETLWDYGHSTDVLGRIIEIASGQSLFQFEKKRLLDPLGMTDTAFYVADAAKRPLVAEAMPDDRFASPVAGIRDPMLARRWESGGAGMVGTIGDYARFAQMLSDGGVLDGKRFLKAETVAAMTSDHIGPETKIARDSFYFPGEGSGFGLGFAVRTSKVAGILSAPGEYRWDGVAGTFFFIDPRDDMFVICMMQSPSQRGRIEMEVNRLVYQALGN